MHATFVGNDTHIFAHPDFAADNCHLVSHIIMLGFGLVIFQGLERKTGSITMMSTGRGFPDAFIPA
jgi:hypothetical protein